MRPIDAAHRRRALARRVRRRRHRPLGVHDRGLDRRRSAPGATSCSARSAAGQHDLAGEMSEGVLLLADAAGRAKASDKALIEHALATLTDADGARGASRRARSARSCAARSSATPSATVRARSSRAAGRGRPRRARASAPGTSCSRARGAACRACEEELPRAGRARLRRALPAADPPDRPDEPQGPQQHAGGRTRRPGLAVGDRRRRRGGHDAVHPDLGTIDDLRAPRRGRAASTASTSRSTSRSSARPTTPG